MKILLTEEIQNFFQRCLYNMQHDRKNTFLDMFVTEENEPFLKKEMEKAGFPHQKESLFLSADDWENSLYHRTVHLDKAESSHFTYETEWMAGNQLFNCDVLQKDPQRELNDFMRLKAMDRDFQAIFLLQDGKDWMMDAPSEAFTNDPVARISRGKVVTFGLGIGYYIFMACQNPEVTSLHVVERSREVIEMFQEKILPQFSTSVPITLICDDAYRKWNPSFLKEFDTIYADIWQSSEDGLTSITKLLELYEPPFEKTHFWIEDSCYEMMWTLSLLHFIELSTGKKQKIASRYIPYMKKIRAYYATVPLTADSVETLKTLMYDTETIRHILATKPDRKRKTQKP